MNKPTISIVANFYKSERYIPKLIKSVLSQTYTDWELICVNDCSPGNDAKVITKFINHPKTNGRIRLINNETNLGISKAKKVGIDNANGKYITFIDGDDWFDPHALERMIAPAIKYNIDLVIMNNIKIIPRFNIKKNQHSIALYNQPIYNPQLFDEYFISFFGVNLLNNYGYWGKLYKLEIVNLANFTPPQNNIYEDILFLIKIFETINSLYFVDYYGYFWRWGGITSSKKNLEFDSLKIIKRLNDISLYRKKLIDKYSYNKAFKYLIYEIKNVLKINLSSIAKYDFNTERAKDLISEINEILSHDVYLFFDEIDKLGLNKDEFTDAIISKNANLIYLYCHKIYKKNWKKRVIYKIMRLLK